MKMTVGKKIGAGFCLAIAALAIIGGTAYRSTLQLVETAGWVSYTQEILRYLEETMSSMKDIETGERGFVITGDESYLEPYRTGLERIEGDVRKLRSLTADNEVQQERLARLEALIVQRLAVIKDVNEKRRMGTFEDAAKTIQSGKGKQMMDQMRKLVGEMEEDEIGLMKKRQEDAEIAVIWSKNVIVFGGLATAILLALAGYFITRNIAQPLGAVTAAAARIAEGDINVEFAHAGRDDEVGALMQTFQRMCRSLSVLAGRARQIAEGDLTAQIKPRSEADVLGNAFANMVASLRSIVQELLEAANFLASSATEIISSTAQLAATATETATAVAETTTTVEEVKQTSQVSSQKAKYVSDQAQQVAAISQGGKSAVGKTIEGMNDIRQQMGAVAESILNLSAQGQAIGEIIATVDDLAAQSKLLAVNASIEAAKAGEEGKGFSVVALEVRTLAEQSKQATTQIRGILSEIQNATTSAVLVTEQATKTVETTLRQSNTATESIGTLAENVAEAAQAAMQIAATSQQQFVGMDQVALAMENIKQASNETVTSTKQAETAARQLHELGQKLKQLVERFKV